jgi:hypothetical protein
LSGYYYTPMRNVFVGALFALGVFLIAYRGYDRSDGIITNIAGVCAATVALCPTIPPGNPTERQTVIGYLHLVFACVAFVMLAVMALRFAKGAPTPAGLSFWKAFGYAFGVHRRGVLHDAPVGGRHVPGLRVHDPPVRSPDLPGLARLHVRVARRRDGPVDRVRPFLVRQRQEGAHRRLTAYDGEHAPAIPAG